MPSGTIARLLIDKGFGFIRDESGVEHFFHRSAVRGAVFELLREGQRVEFSNEDSPKGPRAADVRLHYAHEQTAAVMRCVGANGGRELDHRYGESGAELRFRVPLARYASLERCLRDSTRGAVAPERLGESVGRLSASELRDLDTALSLVLGL